MKTFSSFKAFSDKVALAPVWEDRMKIAGRTYSLYEYGPGPGVSGPDYVYFRNDKTGDMVHITYTCPSYQYVNGEKVQTKQYAFHSWDLEENVEAWR